ncbi:ATP synthase subunit g, mitochondrial [Amphibalanus amphitrite]|uniref:ATP synthase subunit g n=2 Tax=Amphibalanus amphitrite TaxID=1232801 RepID=A0A6A4WBI9_AMPAM|nr:ATP synthase subunit g, mitochondrial-like isoform X2 [Amphibalanus amphitrite]XP_043228797.1 ATP synthase subunit g, mitochondrial-like isoform X2 [Amphibalanus amphitrite]XP_043228798.1 ATP synthase subunit g, mitochondrial-like isoform X2 [Amphibalanus amphitrite]KAF0299408.1 ATP synthase subunit g, mitochondrial [Amphibalanus amphitrite]
MAGVVAKLPAMGTNLVNAARPRLATFLKYARVELTPPSPADVPAIQQGLSNLVKSARTGAWKNLTVKEATVNALVGAEVVFWFFIGECIGKGSLVGYQV